MKRKVITALFGLALAFSLVTVRGYAAEASEAQAQETQQTETETEEVKVLNGIQKIGDKIYYYENNVLLKKSLKKINDNYYYFTSDGSALTNSWKTIDGAKYYFGSNGKAYKGKSRKIGDYYYVFKTSGKLATGDEKRIVKVDGVKFYVTKNGRAISGWQPVEGHMIYAYASGKLAINKKVSYIKIGKNGYATNKWQAFAKYYARKFIDKHTKSSWSRKKKLRKCFRYIMKHRHYVAHYITDKKASTTNGWQYKAAVEMLSSSRLIGNCRSFASSFSAIAKELGYQPYIYSLSWHSITRIGNRWYDNMYGGLFSIKKRSYYSKAKKIFKF